MIQHYKVKAPQFKSFFKFNYHVTVQAALNREHGWYISFKHYAEVVHFTHKSRKSSKELWTQPRCAD